MLLSATRVALGIERATRVSLPVLLSLSYFRSLSFSFASSVQINLAATAAAAAVAREASSRKPPEPLHASASLLLLPPLHSSSATIRGCVKW